MAFFNSSAKVKQAAHPLQPHNLSYRVVGTQDFNTPTVIMAREVVPGDNFTRIKVDAFTRLAPLPVPTYGSIHMVNRAFFVPFRLVWKPWQSFIDGQPYTTGTGSPIVPTVPTISNSAIVSHFIASGSGLTKQASAAQITNRLYQFSDNGGTPKYYVLTPSGKRVYSLLNSLGYRINGTLEDDSKFSLLPLLCYLRVFYDWYYPSQYQDSFQDALTFLNRDLNYTVSSNSDLTTLFRAIQQNIYMEKDYFTAAWNNPNSPNSQSAILFGTNVQFGYDTDLSGLNIANQAGDYGATTQAYLRSDPTTVNGISQISQYGLNMLKSLQDYLNRNAIAGNRHTQRLLARFGIHVKDAVLQRSEYLGSDVSPIQISDVTATGDVKLGDYAGKGIGVNSSSFSYDNKDDYGMLIVISAIQPQTGYVQGRDRHVFHLDKFDFFTPEFDCIGTQPIRNDELFAAYRNRADYNAGLTNGGKPNGVFGFTPRYSEYKVSKDMLLGDFLDNSLSVGMDSYHLFRQFQDPDNEHQLALNLRFLDGSANSDFNDFDRVFSNTTNSADHFISVFNVEVHAMRPMHSLAESLIVDGEGHKTVDLPYNGSNF